jgi:hypothetical protein
MKREEMRERRGKGETKEVSEGNEGEERTRRKNGGEEWEEGVPKGRSHKVEQTKCHELASQTPLM